MQQQVPTCSKAVCTVDDKQQSSLDICIPVCIHVTDMRSRMQLNLMWLHTTPYTIDVNYILILSQNLTQLLASSTNNHHSLLHNRSSSLEQRDTWWCAQDDVCNVLSRHEQC